VRLSAGAAEREKGEKAGLTGPEPKSHPVLLRPGLPRAIPISYAALGPRRAHPVPYST
jgi:hypothetical protein